MMDEVIAALADLRQKGASGALCTVIRAKGSTPRKAGSKMLVFADGSSVGSVGGGEVEARVIDQALQAIQSGVSQVLAFDLIDPAQGDPGICGGSLEIFVDALESPDEVVVVGGGHVGREVVHLAKWLGFKVVLSDDREAFCRPDQVPGADQYIHCTLSELPARYAISPGTALVLATRNQQVDISGLPELLAIPTAYLGVISSKRRWKLTAQALLDQGVDPESLDKVHAPIGLDLGAETPREIALSIMSEVLLVMRGRAEKDDL